MTLSVFESRATWMFRACIPWNIKNKLSHLMTSIILVTLNMLFLINALLYDGQYQCTNRCIADYSGSKKQANKKNNNNNSNIFPKLNIPLDWLNIAEKLILIDEEIDQFRLHTHKGLYSLQSILIFLDKKHPFFGSTYKNPTRYHSGLYRPINTQVLVAWSLRPDEHGYLRNAVESAVLVFSQGNIRKGKSSAQVCGHGPCKT